MSTTKEDTERHYHELLGLAVADELPPIAEAADHLRALQRELDETRNLLVAERAAHAATRGLADAAVRGQMRAEERLEKLEKALEWAAARDKWVRILGYAVDANAGLGEAHDGTGPSIADALIALHERAGK